MKVIRVESCGECPHSSSGYGGCLCTHPFKPQGDGWVKTVGLPPDWCPLEDEEDDDA